MKIDPKFKKPSNNEILLLNNMLDTIKKVLLFIDENLLNKDIIICTKEREVVLKITKRNVPHMFGIFYNGGANAMWRDFRKNRFAIHNIMIKKDGTTFQKLSALASLPDLFTGHCFLTGEGIYEKLAFDSSIRTAKLLLAIGLKFDDSDQMYHPNTALNLKSKILPPGDKVLAIYTEDCETGKIHYLQKNKNFVLR